MKTRTPPALQILPRRPELALPDPLPRHWHSNDPFKTHFFNAMSVLFPDGERYFIDSVRLFRERIIDTDLQQQIRGFIGQEGHHSREHIEYNQRLRDLGYDIDALESTVKKRIRFVQKNFSAERQLAGTVAMEHFTAIMADLLLREPHWIDGAVEPMQSLWRWHALEETEHKAVAFDVYMQVCGDRKILRRAMRQATFFFLKDVTRGMWHMLRKDGKLTDLPMMCRGMRWLWGRNGFFRKLVGVYQDYYQSDFHPWQHDNSDLLDQYAPAFASALVR
ncbi:metal-dependent hydrolase [Pseudomonas sp. gcc21]|uniref:metal-dependent hydrolase n=1 Tax=Pseudomonas sp. gcc21 TaxID=2726989 RepID=UPI0014528910|nr:metal-dependent hydrolase [Pseudomonas sp. gcc21]QJD60775.1 metal-dependent hydrolase [Pseudomonas sp. gcc21]